MGWVLGGKKCGAGTAPAGMHRGWSSVQMRPCSVLGGPVAQRSYRDWPPASWTGSSLSKRPAEAGPPVSCSDSSLHGAGRAWAKCTSGPSSVLASDRCYFQQTLCTPSCLVSAPQHSHAANVVEANSSVFTFLVLFSVSPHLSILPNTLLSSHVRLVSLKHPVCSAQTTLLSSWLRGHL